MLAPYLLIGEITRPQGIRGEVKVRHYTDDPFRFQDLDRVFVQQGKEYVPMAVTASRVQKDDVFLTLQGVADRDGAEKLRGVKLYVDRAHARPLEEDQVFIADILGAAAYDTKGQTLGTLREVLTPGGVDVFVLDTPRGTLMVPALKTVLLEMDPQQGKIVLDEARLEEVGLYEDRGSDAVPRDV
ncbi:MAG: ribosome maturation factor RimM [Candidatus Limiplasma sp.]|nr:ribosome maturation factor RimM [Candidatus Limiplasma sp.]